MMKKVFSFIIASCCLLPGHAVAQEGEEIIYEAPEGVSENLVRDGYAYYVDMFNWKLDTYRNVVGEMVICDNGEVYLKNPISLSPTGSYLKGHKEGTEIVFDLPQPITVSTDFGYPRIMMASLLQFAEPYGTFVVANSLAAAEIDLPEIENKLVITINDDNSYSYLSTTDDYGMPIEILGMTYGDRDTWNGFAEIYSNWVPFTDKAISPPDDLNKSTVEILYNETGHLATIGFDNEEVYIKGLFNIQPEGWMKGLRTGNSISFPSGQYLGKTNTYNYYPYFTAAAIVPVYDEVKEEWNNTLEYREEITFEYDEATQTLFTSENGVVISNASLDEILPMSYIISPTLKVQPADISQTPQNPYDLQYDDMYEEYERNFISFSLPIINIDGYLLNVDNLYYKVFIDGDEFIFTSDDYFVTEDMALVPFRFNNNWDIGGDGNRREICLYFDGADEFGVQLFSVIDGEIVGNSEMVRYVINSAIQSIQTSQNDDIISTKYYDMTGREVNGKTKGILIEQVVYHDGSIKKRKVVRK